MENDTIEFFFDQATQARRDLHNNESDESEMEAEDMFTPLVEKNEGERDVCSTAAASDARGNNHRPKPLVVKLGNGDWHVCFGARCPHADLNKQNDFVCNITGMLVGRETIRESDPSWTGKSGQSANPDECAVTVHGFGWRKKRDMFSASVSAWKTSKVLDAREVDPVPNAKPEKMAVKRGALCVDEKTPDPSNKRARANKKEMEGLEKLVAEAGQVITKLLSTERQSSTPAVSNRATITERAETKGVDLRLQNPNFVMGILFKKHIRMCLSSNQAIDMVSLHDCSVQAHRIAGIQRQKAGPKKEAACSRIFLSGQTATLASNLIVALWRACCLTPHMLQSKRGSDSFRPFAVGVLYATKRGFEVNGGLVVVPVIPEIACLLPSLRTPGMTTVAKQLQASSHRGMCSMHRSVASLQEMGEGESAHIQDAFRVAAQTASILQSHIKSSVRK